MEKKIIKFDQIISQQDIDNGNLILLAGRPATGKTQTICELIKKYKKQYGYLYFDFDGNGSNHWLADEKNGIIKEYQSSVGIIQTIQKSIDNNLKFVFIDYWQLVENTDVWFLRILSTLAFNRKLVIIITSQLDRKVIHRKDQIPITADFKTIKNLFIYSRKVIVIKPPSLSPSQQLNMQSKMKYKIYKGS